MAALDEETFNAAFGERLRWVREDCMHASRPKFAKRLGVSSEQLKRYETRPKSAFPLYLLPELIVMTFEPYEFWIGELPSQHWAHRTGVVPVNFRKSQRRN